MINQNPRITLMDNAMSTIIKMSDGNPGAVICLTEMLKKDDWAYGVPGIMMILNLDSMEIYGDRIYMLWNDCCDRDLVKMELVLRNWQMGHLTDEELDANLSQGRGTEFKNLKTLQELFDKEEN